MIRGRSWEVRPGYTAPSHPPLEARRPVLELDPRKSIRPLVLPRQFYLDLEMVPVFDRPPLYGRAMGGDTVSIWEGPHMRSLIEAPSMGCCRVDLRARGTGAWLKGTTLVPFQGSMMGGYRIKDEDGVVASYTFPMAEAGIIEEGGPLGALAVPGSAPDAIRPLYVHVTQEREKTKIEFRIQGVSLGEAIRQGKLTCALMNGSERAQATSISCESPVGASAYVRVGFTLN